ncbi:EpsG family protein [Pseudoalteromonas sp. SR43-7]|uniref:EpsG family protein n=1 Tax=Pseudoalteromonas sp. SR43-7 TaxID=2760939 RepID=UPI0015FACD0C|nr:EpsG family protein [Pseudoalteromonas sp. SR43-7]MBB1328171.1 EpsG family protein [Pseudoalteromonas sp. SR43-7]
MNKELLYSAILYLLFLPILFYFINFDSAQNLDYGGYKDNYEKVWNQFELGYTFLEDISRSFMLPFESFWSVLIFIELIFIALLYSNPYVFILAFPNLLFLSQGLLGTQIRFGIATLLCLVIFKFFINKRRFYMYSLGAALFHNATSIFLFLSFFLKKMLNVNEKVTFTKNFKSLLLYIALLLTLSVLVNYILIFMGYYYYAEEDSKHMVIRSTSSLVYMSSVLVFILVLLNKKSGPVEYSPMVYLGALLLVFSLVFYKYSIISGRYNVVYMLVEPFVLYSFYKSVGKKSESGFIFFLIFIAIANSKLLLLNLIF